MAKVVLDVGKVVLDVGKVVLDVGKVVLDVGKVVLDVGEGGAGRGPALPSSSPSPHHHRLLKSALFPLLRLS